MIRTGRQYRNSIRDGREVYIKAAGLSDRVIKTTAGS